MTLRYAHPAPAHTPSGPAPVTAQAHRHQARGPSDHGMSASTSHPFLVDPGDAVMPPRWVATHRGRRKWVREVEPHRGPLTVIDRRNITCPRWDSSNCE